MSTPRGTRGYAEQAPGLIESYDSLDFAHKHAAVLHLVPPTPSRVLDVGAGTGADAAWLAQRGHRVLAVEPTEAFRRHGMARHASPRIEWLDDSLPALVRVMARRESFDLVFATAVWMHLDGRERATAMRVVASLLAPGGSLVMSLRHGPVPAGRVMFEVTPEETLALAAHCGLQSRLVERQVASLNPANRNAGVTWSVLAFTMR